MIHTLYGGDIGLDFDEKRHIYTVPPDDTIIPSVTGITKVIDKSGPLMWWSVGQCIEWIQENLSNVDLKDEVAAVQFWHDAHRAHLRSAKKAADIGTLAHEWIDKWLRWKAGMDGAAQPSMPVNKILLTTVQSFLDWAEDVDLSPIQTEFKVYSREHGYAGTCDFDGFLNHGTKRERAVIDWKTSKAVYDEYGIQTMAYKMAREEEFAPQYGARYCVAIPQAGGGIKVKRWGPEDDELHESAFLGCLAIHRALKK